MGKSVIAIIAVVVVVAVAGTGIGVYVSSLPTPEKTIERFEDAYNEVLLEDMVECFEPSVQLLYSGFSGIVDSLIGVNTTDILALIGGAMPFIDGQYIDGEYFEMPKMDIEVQNVVKEDDYAEATVTVTLSSSEFTETSEGVMYLTFVEDEWYLCADNLF